MPENSPIRGRLWAAARLLAAALILAATVEQARLAAVAASAAGMSPALAVARLFSFFTVESNAVLFFVLLIAGILRLARPRGVDGPRLAFALAAASTYILLTGLVYNAVLRGESGILGGWSNDVHHVIAPLFMVLDIAFAPGRRALPWRAVAGILAFPLVWVALTLLTGPFRGSLETGVPPWYPYPFLNPTITTGGYAGVALWVAAISILVASLAAVVILVGRRRGCR